MKGENNFSAQPGHSPGLGVFYPDKLRAFANPKAVFAWALALIISAGLLTGCSSPKPVATSKPSLPCFYVGGEVNHPGRYAYIGKMTVLDAINAAGGLTYAHSRIEILRANGQKITLNYKKLLTDPSQNIEIFPNDRVWSPKTPW